MKRTLISGIMLLASAAMLGAQASPQYDRASEKTVAGTLKTVVAIPAADGSVAVHLDLSVGQDVVSVHVGPALFIGEQNFFFFAGDELAIVGTPMTIDGNVSIWAKAIQKGSTVLSLRTAEGAPKWASADNGIDGCGVNHLPIPRGTER